MIGTTSNATDVSVDASAHSEALDIIDYVNTALPAIAQKLAYLRHLRLSNADREAVNGDELYLARMDSYLEQMQDCARDLAVKLRGVRPDERTYTKPVMTWDAQRAAMVGFTCVWCAAFIYLVARALFG